MILKLEEPFGLSTAAVSAKLSRNGAIKFKIAARRNPAFKGAIALSLTKLPKGLKADPARIAAGATDVEIVLSASADAPPGPVKGLTVRGEAKVGNGKFSARVPVTGISIE